MLSTSETDGPLSGSLEERMHNHTVLPSRNRHQERAHRSSHLDGHDEAIGGAREECTK